LAHLLKGILNNEEFDWERYLMTCDDIMLICHSQYPIYIKCADRDNLLRCVVDQCIVLNTLPMVAIEVKLETPKDVQKVFNSSSQIRAARDATFWHAFQFACCYSNAWPVEEQRSAAAELIVTPSRTPAPRQGRSKRKTMGSKDRATDVPHKHDFEAALKKLNYLLEERQSTATAAGVLMQETFDGYVYTVLHTG